MPSHIDVSQSATLAKILPDKFEPPWQNAESTPGNNEFPSARFCSLRRQCFVARNHRTCKTTLCNRICTPGIVKACG